jgi:hypothetical protein
MFAIELRAVTPDRRRRRAYEIHVGPDLFGQLVVAIDFGVMGTRGRRLVRLMADTGQAKVVVRQVLRRRLTAPRRIGVPYRVVACHDPEHGLEAMGFQVTDGGLRAALVSMEAPA